MENCLRSESWVTTNGGHIQICPEYKDIASSQPLPTTLLSFSDKGPVNRQPKKHGNHGILNPQSLTVETSSSYQKGCIVPHPHFWKCPLSGQPAFWSLPSWGWVPRWLGGKPQSSHMITSTITCVPQVLSVHMLHLFWWSFSLSTSKPREGSFWNMSTAGTCWTLERDADTELAELTCYSLWEETQNFIQMIKFFSTTNLCYRSYNISIILIRMWTWFCKFLGGKPSLPLIGGYKPPILLHILLPLLPSHTLVL